MSTIDPADYAALKEQVATLRQQVAELTRFIRVERDDDDQLTGLTLYANVLTTKTLIIIDDQSRHRGRLCAWDDEAALSLFDEDEKPRVILRASRADSAIELRNPENNRTAEMSSDDDGHGQVVVFSPGEIPRVLMKGLADGGSVATLDPDGSPRGAFLASGEKNEVVFVSREKKPVARLGAYEHGGLVRLEGNASDAMASVGVGPHGGTVLLQTNSGERGVSALASDAGNLFKVDCFRSGEEASGAGGITLLGLKDISSISLRAKDGTDVVDLISGDSGGSVITRSGVNKSSASLSATGTDPIIQATHDKGTTVIMLASETTGQIRVVHQDGSQNASLGVAEHGGFLGISDNDTLRVSLGCDDSERPFVALHNEDGSAALQLLRHEHGGAATVFSEDGTRQVAMMASEAGGQLGLFGDLGIERAVLQTHGDGAALSLRWGGTTGLKAVASEAGGAIVVYDRDGLVIGTLPENLERRDADDDSEAEE